jgi:hypothetical protein
MRKNYTKVEYFSKLLLFTAICLPLDKKLIHNSNSMQGIIMVNFVQATEYEVYMYEKLEYLNMYIFL